MCGIYGYIGERNAYNEVKNGLKLLQYRGYDSCGIAYFSSEFKIVKAVGTLDNLPKQKKYSRIAFGHTRWATNGGVNLQNTHPHISQNGEFVIVHNGIINNFELIKQDLINKNYHFNSETDTEVIANLLESLNGSNLEKIKQLFDILQGSFSLIIGDKSGKLYAVKQFSPLHILKSKDGIYISSDINSLPNGDLYSLKDGDIVVVENNEIKSINEIKYVEHKNKLKSQELKNYPHYMLKEIDETAIAIKNTYLSINKLQFKKIFKHFNKLTLLGCGTAYHSCLVGEWMFNEYTKIQADCYLASNYHIKKIKKNHLHIIVSQSGETADCIKIAREIKQYGGKILVITNEDKSTITNYADFKILTKAGKELAVASTKTYSCQVFTFAYIINKLIDKKYEIDINNFYQMLTKYIEDIDVSDLANVLTNVKHLVLIGKGLDYLTILEASLKIREIDYIYTIPMFASELKHGTLSLIEENSYVLALNTNKNESLLTTMNEIKSRNGVFIDMSNYIENIQIDNKLLAIFSIIPFQKLSYEIAINNGLNPDMPRNLAKSVTVE